MEKQFINEDVYFKFTLTLLDESNKILLQHYT